MLFTIEQVKAAHSKVKSGADFPAYVQDLIGLGVLSYETFVDDGRTVYFGKAGFSVQSEAKYEVLNVAHESHKAQFITDLKTHQAGGTDYPTFCNDCAKSGVEKWVVDTTNMTCSYYDKSGRELLVEHIPI